jgi:hypothetical protein
MTRGERDLRAQQVAAGPLQFVQRPGLCHGQQAERGVRCARPVLGLRRGQRPLGAPRRVQRQPGGPLQERGRRRQTTAALGPACAMLKFGGNVLIGAGRGLGTVPGPPVRIDSRVGGLGQRAVQLLPRLERCRPVGRRADQRMPEPHPRAELRQPRLRRRPRRPGADREPPGRPPHQHRVAGRIGRRQLQQPPGLRWQGLQLPPEALLDPPVQRYRAADPEPARQLRRREPPRQLQQRQRVPARFGDDPVPDPRVQRSGQPGQHRLQQLPRIVLGQALHHQLWQPGHVLARDPRREHQAHRVRSQPPRREPQRLRRSAVQPLLVIHHAYQRTFPGCLGQQADHGQAHQEPVRRQAGAEAERGPQRLALRTRERLGMIQHRRAQLMQPRERQLHFGLHAGGPRDQAPGGPRSQVIKQRSLAHPRLTAHHQRPALTSPHPSHEPVKYVTFAEPARQPGCGPADTRMCRHRPGATQRPWRQDRLLRHGDTGTSRRFRPARHERSYGPPSQTPPTPARQPTPVGCR